MTEAATPKDKKQKKERVGRMVQMHANNREEIKEVLAGDIAAAVGLKDVTTGDTLCDPDNIIVLERMDGGRFHTLHSCTTKAVCAASNRRETSAKGAVGQDLDVVHALGLALAAGPERWTAMEGGAPVMVDGECIGGIGVSGGDWQTDLRIAKAAVESIGASWK